LSKYTISNTTSKTLYQTMLYALSLYCQSPKPHPITKKNWQLPQLKYHDKSTFLLHPERTPQPEIVEARPGSGNRPFLTHTILQKKNH